MKKKSPFTSPGNRIQGNQQKELSIAWVIVAAGSGSRFGSGSSKQFLRLNGKEVFQHSLDLFLEQINKSPAGKCTIVLVLPQNKIQAFPRKYPKYNKFIKKVLLCLVPGGKSRAESVFNGIDHIKNYGLKYVIVHDAARPLINSEVLELFLQKLAKISKGTLLLAGHWARDTILWSTSDNQRITKILVRDRVFQAETPQGFFIDDYLDAKRKISSPQWRGAAFSLYTDESSMFLALKKRVNPFTLTCENSKITFPEDLEIANKLLTQK